MIEPFGLSRLWLLKKLERKGTPFGLQRTLTRPTSPFWRALSSYVSVHDRNVHTYVIWGAAGKGVMSGAAQLCECAGRPEAEILYIAPSLSSHPEARCLWLQLLSRVCERAGELGLQRLFAGVLWGGEELEVLRQVGFITYAREEVLRLDEIPDARQTFPLDGLRSLRSDDGHRLKRLYEMITPRRVRLAEGENPPLSWLRDNNSGTLRGTEAYLYENQDGETASALLTITPGKTGHLLEIVWVPDRGVDVDDLLDFGLERISNWTHRPVYTAVREYQSGIMPALIDRGFYSYARQAVTVKNTTVWAKDPLQNMLPVTHKRVEPSTPPVTLLNGEAVSDCSKQAVAAIAGSTRD